MTDINDVMAKLSPKTRARVKAAQEIKVEKLETPSIKLNQALGGGLAFGRQVMVWGNKSAGKSSLCLQIVANAQREGKLCGWIDAEQSFDSEWAKSLGVDVEALLVSKAKTVEDMTHDAIEFIKAGAKVVVTDSISALLSSAYFDKKSEELSDLNDTKQIGSLSRDLANAFNMINYVNEDTLFIIISQLRNQISHIGAFPKPMGGFAATFFSSTVLKLWSTPNDDKQIKGDVYVGDMIVSKNIGRPVDFLVEYNKTSAPGTSGQYDFYYQGADVGVDQAGEVLDLAVDFGLVVRSGAWYVIDDNKYQGRPKAVNALKAEPELFDKIRSEVIAKLG